MIPSKVLCREVSLACETFKISSVLLHEHVQICRRPCDVFVISTVSQFYLVVCGGINELACLGACYNATCVPVCICEYKEQLLVGFSSGLVRYFLWQKGRLVYQSVSYARDLNYMLSHEGYLYIFTSGEILRLSITTRLSLAIDCRDVIYACAAYSNFFVIKSDGQTAQVATAPIFSQYAARSTLFNAEKAQFTVLFYTYVHSSYVQLSASLKRASSRYLLNSAFLTRVTDQLLWIFDYEVNTFDFKTRKHLIRRLPLVCGVLTSTGEVVDIDGRDLRIYSRQEDYYNVIYVLDLNTDAAAQHVLASDASAVFYPAGAGIFISNGQILSLQPNDQLVDYFKSILRSSILTRSSETDYLIQNFVGLSPEHLDTDQVILETLLRHLRNFVTSDVLKICAKCLQNRLKSECYEIVINVVRSLRCYDYAKDIALIYQFMQKLLQMSAFGQSFYIQEIFKAALDKFGHLFLCLADGRARDDYTRVFEELAVFSGLKLKILLYNYRTFLDDKADYASMARACDSVMSLENVYMKSLSVLIDLLILSGKKPEALRVVAQIDGIVPLLFVKMQPEHFPAGQVEIRHQPVDISAILKANRWFQRRPVAERFREVLDHEVRTIDQINECHSLLDALETRDKNILLQTIAVHPLVKVSSFHQILFMEIFCRVQDDIPDFEPTQQQFELIQDIFASTNDQLQLFNLLYYHNNMQLIIQCALQTGNYLSAIALLLRTNQAAVGLYNGILQILYMIKLGDVDFRDLGDNADELIEPIWILFKLIFEMTVGTAGHKNAQNLILFKYVFLERETIMLKILRFAVMKANDEQEISFIEQLELSQPFLNQLWLHETAAY